MEGNETSITDPVSGKVDRFTFDFSYFWDSEQETVYNDLGRPMLEQALEGYNGTIFAYGQTGSGKSYSMMGYNEDIGIIPMMNHEIFEKINEAPKNIKFEIIITYLEIYNERIQDLLNPSPKELKVREHKKLGFIVPDLYKAACTTTEQIVQKMEEGNAVRVVAATKMNDTSSRSHSVFTIHIRQEDMDNPMNGALTAKINLVDLAGSERAESTGATGDTLKQGAAINKSLSALGRVIRVLAKGDSAEFVPYRDSALTKVLRESLGGNARTVMLAALSPADKNYEETLSTLKYANSAKNIKNKSRKNEDKNTQLIRELREEIEKLRQGLTGGLGDGMDMAAMEEYQEKMEELEIAKEQTYEQVQKQQQELEAERQKNLRQRGVMEALKSNLKQQNEQRINELREKKNALMAKYTETKQKLVGLKEMLQRDRQAYIDGGEQDEQLRQKNAKAQQMLMAGKKGLEEMAERYKNVEQQLVEEEQLGSSDDLVELQQKEMERLKKKQKEEVEMMKRKVAMALEQKKKEMQAQFAQMQESQVDTKEFQELQVENVELRSQNDELQSTNKILEKRAAELEQLLEEERLKFDMEKEKQQLQLFRLFRKYREHFEEEGKAKEKKLLSLVDEAVTDAIYLSNKLHMIEEGMGSSSSSS
eukprot:TRINITY_DN5785_c0_g1_i1.p1 TRINITY_DN5785_c0_g1~~TRINITY_DN5785_c0_g1_i1.p1  ORF type:complete len:649 (+),score=311.18 TRINITY_DN5785_c0_g1_i1:918-2864(+)